MWTWHCWKFDGTYSTQPGILFAAVHTVIRNGYGWLALIDNDEIKMEVWIGDHGTKYNAISIFIKED